MITVLNDLHIGVIRSAGTTPATALALRRSLLDDYGSLLAGITSDLLINGDMFDQANIPLSDMLSAFKLSANWLVTNPDRQLWLANGNHDLSKNSSIFSSFEFLAQLLIGLHPERVHHIADLTEIKPGIWVLPHLPNQDLFEAALAKVPECAILAVHANYDNNFAVQSDNSLNVSAEQAAKCKAKHIVFGHEHQTRTAIEGKVLIPGSQLISSVSDCLGATERFATVIDDEGKPEFIHVGSASYTEMQWFELKETEAKFIRVTGNAHADEGAEVAQKISRYRAKSTALVITNAVMMETAQGTMEGFAKSMESVKSFDVLSALLKHLTQEEGDAIRALPQ